MRFHPYRLCPFALAARVKRHHNYVYSSSLVILIKGLCAMFASSSAPAHSVPDLDHETSHIFAAAQTMAAQARATILPFFRSPKIYGDAALQYKADASPVTLADQQAEDAIRAVIHSTFPDHGIIGEERGSDTTDSPYTWVIDPIDGTRAFLAGLPLFGTLIACLKHGQPWFGMIHQPILNETWWGFAATADTTHANSHAYYTTADGTHRPLQCRPCATLANAYLACTTPDMFSTCERPRFDALHQQVRDTRFGTDCYAYGTLSLGCVDLICEADMKLYDFAALIPIVHGAGGGMCTWEGMPLIGDVLDARTPHQVLAYGDARLKDAAIAALAI
jgi:histidinol phosphatase-like enzyme (inositol monophosphatase family)